MAVLDVSVSERIQAEARTIQPARAVKTGLMVAAFYSIGWVAGKVSVAGRYVLAAVKVGWRDARMIGGEPIGPAR